jgi:hypothetical protein
MACITRNCQQHAGPPIPVDVGKEEVGLVVTADVVTEAWIKERRAAGVHVKVHFGRALDEL